MQVINPSHQYVTYRTQYLPALNYHYAYIYLTNLTIRNINEKHFLNNFLLFYCRISLCDQL